MTEPQGHVQFGPPKTKAGRRTISVPASIVDELASRVAAYVVGSGRAPEALIFAGDHGGPSGRTISGAERGRRHSRHPSASPATPTTSATRMRRSGFKLGVHPKTIQVRLGHASIKTTMDLYGHLYEGVDEAAAQALDALHRSALENAESKSKQALT